MYVLVLGDVELYMVCRDPGVKCVNIMLYKVVILFTAYRMVEEDIISIYRHITCLKEKGPAAFVMPRHILYSICLNAS